MKGQVQLESKTALFEGSYCDDNSPIRAVLSDRCAPITQSRSPQRISCEHFGLRLVSELPTSLPASRTVP